MNGSHIYTFNNFTNSTNHLKSDWGPKRDPLYIVIPISIIYIFIFISGIVGNISTCIVIARNKCMHTATNYYLFSLAVSDLLLLISGLPPEIYSIWSKYPYIFGEEFCIMQGFAAEASANATVLTITAFTVERYVAICYPFLSHTLSKLSRAVKYIISIWLFAISLAVPQALSFGIVCEVINDQLITDHCICALKRNIIPHAFEISSVLFFVAPMSLISILYILIGNQLNKSHKLNRNNSVKIRHRVCKHTFGSNSVHKINKEVSHSKIYAKNAYATKHVVKMLVAVVIAFFICWAPFHAQRLFAVYGAPSSRPMIAAFQILTYISGILYYLSTTINPLLYHIMSRKFRDAFKATCKQCCCKKRQRLPGGKCYSSLSARSSQMNSHSTDSQNQYVEAELVQMHDRTRPLVVSFRRNYKESSGFKAHPLTRFNTRYNEEIHLDFEKKGNTHLNLNRTDIQLALEFLRSDCLTNAQFRFEPDGFRGTTKVNDFKENNLLEKCSFVDVNKLQPTHICPLNTTIDFL